MPPTHSLRSARLCCSRFAQPRVVTPSTLTRACVTAPAPTRQQQQHSRAYSKSAYSYQQVKALVFSKHGEPADVLNLHQHSISPGLPSGTVLLRTLGAPINPADINIIQGTYGKIPPMTTTLGTSEPSIVPGNEGVFEVLSLGDNVPSGLAPGDWVIPASTPFGTWRTHALVPATDVLRIDKTGLKIVDAAAVSVNPCTAYRVLRAFGPADSTRFDGAMAPLEPGSGAWFIQNGANSGVGRAAIQFGRAWGLRSINVVRERETQAETDALREELRALGADEVITETELLSREWRDKLASITRGGREKPGLGLNCVGGQSATALTKSLGEGGTLVTYGAMARKPAPIPAGLMIFNDVRLVGFWLSRWSSKDPTGKRHAVNDILNMARSGSFVQSPVDEITWKWDTKIETLRDAVAGALGGMRNKGMFVFEPEE
jgi:trans-2-enoyl-CoA reductase